MCVQFQCSEIISFFNNTKFSEQINARTHRQTTTAKQCNTDLFAPKDVPNLTLTFGRFLPELPVDKQM